MSSCKDEVVEQAWAEMRRAQARMEELDRQAAERFRKLEQMYNPDCTIRFRRPLPYPSAP